MKLIGFNFNKINVERFSQNFENLKINTNINILEINKADTNLFKSEEKIIEVKFSYFLDYQDKKAQIELNGAILFALEPKEAEDVLKQWKDKKIPEKFKTNLFNFILKKTNIKAIQLEDELNLPIHLPFPKVEKNNLEKESEKKQ